MAAIFRNAPVLEHDHYGVTIAVAVLLRVQGPTTDAHDIERWVHEIDAVLLPLLGADANTPVELLSERPRGVASGSPSPEEGSRTDQGGESP
jgi:hypothetical protein